MIQDRTIVDEPMGSLIQRLVGDGRVYVQAEADVLRASVRARVASAKVAVIVGVGAIFIAQAGLTVLFIALGSALALFLPLWAGQLIAALIALGIAGAMVYYAATHFTPPVGQPDGDGRKDHP